jgi:hypothetical protein
MVIADPEHKGGSLQTEYGPETVAEQNMYFLVNSHPVLHKGAVASNSKKANVMSISSTEAYRRQEMDGYLGRCIERHQSLLK